MNQTFPSPAEEELSDILSLDKYLLPNRQSSFMIKAGRKIKEAGILPQDIIIFERGRLPVNGDLVIAEVDHKWLMRFWQKINGRIKLFSGEAISGGAKEQPLIPEEELKLIGVVTAAFRKYH